MQKIYPSRYCFSKSSIDYILKNFRKILENRSFLTMGRYGEEFEKEFAAYVGSKHAITVNSGTAALEVILAALDIKEKEVIVTTNTFAATIFAILKAGGIPVFADILHDMTIDPADVLKKITKKTKAVVTVHIGGMVSPATKNLVDLCKERNLFFVEDAAHAHGSALNKKQAGTFGIAGAFSFFSTKVITTGEGGMIVTDNDVLADQMRIIRNQAKESTDSFYPNFHKRIGFNFRMAEVQALMGIAQLKELDKFIVKRQKIATIFRQNLRGVKNLEIISVPSIVRHNYYKFIVFLENNLERDDFAQQLKNKFNIPLSGCAYELPCHKQPAFRMFAKGSFPVAEDLARRHIALPIYYEMTDRQAAYVANAIKVLAVEEK